MGLEAAILPIGVSPAITSVEQVDPLDRTVSTPLVRLVRDAARRAGATPEQQAGLHGLDEHTLSDELNRIPLDALIRLWEFIAHLRPGPGAGLAVATAAPLGTLTPGTIW